MIDGPGLREHHERFLDISQIAIDRMLGLPCFTIELLCTRRVKVETSLGNY